VTGCSKTDQFASREKRTESPRRLGRKRKPRKEKAHATLIKRERKGKSQSKSHEEFCRGEKRKKPLHRRLFPGREGKKKKEIYAFTRYRSTHRPEKEKREATSTHRRSKY